MVTVSARLDSSFSQVHDTIKPRPYLKWPFPLSPYTIVPFPKIDKSYKACVFTCKVTDFTLECFFIVQVLNLITLYLI